MFQSQLHFPAEYTSEGGGANRDRTDDLYNAIVALSQLSYGPQNRVTFLKECDLFTD